jgi:hypothetical protein
MLSNVSRMFLASLLLGSLSSAGWAQYAVPNLLPFPPLPVGGSAVAPAAMNSRWYESQEPTPAVPPAPLIETEPSPSDQPIGGDYLDAMKGDYEGAGCTSCNAATGCGHGHYLYANALLMTRDQRGGFITSVDGGSGAPAAGFTSSNLPDAWHGGFELGAGWCFGADSRCGVEAVYWGLYPADIRRAARGNLNSTIDFSDLTYNGASAGTNFTAAQVQEVRSGFDFNSVEFNLLGNGGCGGPFGCGMCGCCVGRAGAPWGFGWVAGFRYINFSEDWAFSSDTTDDQFNGDPTELSYDVQLNNNLFGFQLGSGLSYCITNSLTAYAIGKVGIYNNHITQTQRVLGPAGDATVNSGLFTGDAFLADGGDDDLAFSGQLDLGGRWAVSDRWSVNFGYRTLGLAGVATAETNVQRGGFQNMLGIADPQTGGSFILHGGYAGATYCW